MYPGVDQQNWGASWAERPLLFHNNQGKLKVVLPVEGAGLAEVAVERGMAFGDLFNDGRVDVLVNVLDGPPLLLRNVTKTANHWIGFVMVGGRKVAP